jgi:YidC/Oxa1 family membrane protein insertase
MFAFFFTVFYQPILNALVFLYDGVARHDLGVAIIFLTIGIRLILFPFFQKSARHQAIMQRLAPRIKEIKAQHKNNREKEVRETMALYKEHQVNPFFGILFLLIQLPVLISLFQILRHIGADPTPELYTFIASPGVLSGSFLGLLNLQKPSILLVVLAALAQYIQGKMSLPKIGAGQELSDQERIQRQMVYVGPFVTLIAFYNFPAAATLYWFVSSLFSIGQQSILEYQLRTWTTGNPT